MVGLGFMAVAILPLLFYIVAQNVANGDLGKTARGKTLEVVLYTLAVIPIISFVLIIANAV